MIKVFPDKDIKLAKKLLEKRDFESLLELLDSDIYLVRKHQSKENDELYSNVNLDDLIELREKITEYMSFLISPDEEYNDYSYIEDYD
jgi:hypothetical protein